MWSDSARHQWIGVGAIDAVVGTGRWDVPAVRPGAARRARAVTSSSTTTGTDRSSAAARALFGRPTWRGRMHTWAFFLAVPCGAFLVMAADEPAARTAAAIYATTLVLVFGTSAAYHRLTRTERARTIMQRLDHAMIYLLIAGTYTPLCIVALPPVWGIPVLVFVVSLAALGVVLKLLAFDRLRRLSYGLYPAMGWTAIAVAPVLFRHLSPGEIWLVVAGGAAYSAGLPILMVQRPDPWPTLFGYHEVWHVVTIVAATLHFAAVSNVVA